MMQKLHELIIRLQSAIDDSTTEKLSIDDLAFILAHFKRVQSSYELLLIKKKERQNETS
jgi:hypothetical protein